MKVYINGNLFDASEAKISVFDHGFLYGDGVFEGIRLYCKRLFKLEAHLERLEYSAKSILLDLPFGRAELIDGIRQTCRANSLDDAYIRLIVTRGKGSLGLSPKSCKNPQVIIIADQIQLYTQDLYTQGLKIITVPTRRISQAALPPTVKSLNYLNNILAHIEAIQSGSPEALMLNEQGYVAECSGDNVFIVHKGQLMTPLLSTGALRGVTRQVILDLARNLEVPTLETQLTRYDIWNADECFLTGTAAEIIPVVELDSRRIGDGRPGPLTGRLRRRFQNHVASQGFPI